MERRQAGGRVVIRAIRSAIAAFDNLRCIEHDRWKLSIKGTRMSGPPVVAIGAQPPTLADAHLSFLPEMRVAFDPTPQPSGARADARQPLPLSLIPIGG